MERALAIRERVLAPDHPDTAQSLNDLGILLNDLGHLAAARPLMERALTIRERNLGPNHAEVAENLNNLAVLLSPCTVPVRSREEPFGAAQGPTVARGRLQVQDRLGLLDGRDQPA